MTPVLNSMQRMPARLLQRHSQSRTLLLVDDEPHIISAIRRQLRRTGIRLLSAASGEQGLAVLAKERVDLIVTGQRMEGMSGLEFLRIARRLYPETARIVLTGFAEKSIVGDAIREGIAHRFLTKPWDDGVLHACIEEAFALGQEKRPDPHHSRGARGPQPQPDAEAN